MSLPWAKIPFNSTITLLQNCPGLHIIFYRPKRTSLFVTDPCKNLTMLILMFINEKESKDVKMIISSSADHIAFVLFVQIIAIRYFLHIVQPLRQPCLSCHGFSSDINKRKKWIHAICRNGQDFKTQWGSTSVCSRHLADYGYTPASFDKDASSLKSGQSLVF